MGLFLTDADCIRQREYVSIPEWHSKGFLGDRLNVFCDDVGGNHVSIVADILQVILPKAKIYTGSIGYTQKSDIITDCTIWCDETQERLPFDEFVDKYEINLINNSKTGGEGAKVLPIAEYMSDKIKKHNLIFCGAGGNSSGSQTTQPYNGACIVVASCNLKNNMPVWSHTATGENIDFAMFTGFAAGSSFASPFLLGLCGLLRSKYKGITQDEAYEYLKAHSQDILDKGKDEKSGWGLPIMGETKTIIKMQIGNKVMDVDGRKVTLDQEPIIKNSRTLVPLRAITESLGAKVEWNEPTKTITIER